MTNITPQPALRRRSTARLLALLTACCLLAAACSSSDDTSSDDTSTATSTISTSETGDAPADDSQVSGVTEDTITIGYVYLDLDAVRERGLINLNFGPQGEHVQTIVDHINANGGINGRNIELIARAVDPVGSTDARSACLELTEDAAVFAVLGAVRRDEALCYTEQHDTIAIVNAGLTQERLDRSTAPYASVNVARERSIESFVADGAQQGLFAERTIAVLSTDAVEVAADIAIPTLNNAGVSVDFEYLIQGDGTLGSAALELASSVESMRAQGVDTVFVVGDAILAVNTFIGTGFFPTLFFTDQGSATVTAGRADLSLFEAVYTYGQASTSERSEDPRFQQDCAAPWDALNPNAATRNPAEVPEGEPNQTVGLLVACRALAVFTSIAEAAGPTLNNETFGAALDGLGEFDLPGTESASLGDGKHDALDDLRLWIHNPDAADNEPAFIEVAG